MRSVDTFATEWPDIEQHVRRLLAARGLAAQDRDDVVQETALRLYRVWPDLDEARPVTPYAVSIALNICRDMWRTVGRTSAYAEPMRAAEDVEDVVVAREELSLVARAIRAMSAPQRALLLAHDELTEAVPLTTTQRVARMRLRRRLEDAIGRVGAALAPWVQQAPRLSDVAAGGCACAALATTMLGGPALSTPALGRTIHLPHVAAAVAPPVAIAPTRHVAAPHALSVAPRPATVETAATPPRSQPDQSVHRQTVCAPASRPKNGPRTSGGATIGSGGISEHDQDGSTRQIVTTPATTVDTASGCVTSG